MSIAVLSIDLEAKLANLAEGMDQAFRLVEKRSNDIAAAFDGPSRAIRELGPSFAAAFGTGAITEFLRRTSAGLDALNDFADVLGTSIENASALEDAAVRTGTALETVESVALRLNKVLAEAAPGTDQAKVLQAIGLSAQELRRQDPADALLQVAQALQQVDDKTQAALVLQLMGKSAREAAPFLKDLAQAGTLVATVTSEQARQAEQLNKQFASINKAATDLARNFAGEVLPVLNEAFDLFNGKGPGELSPALANALQAVAVLGANVKFVLTGVGTELGGIAAQAAAVARLDFGSASAIGRAMREDAKAAREEFDQLERRLMQSGTAPQADYSNEGRNAGKRRSFDVPDFLGTGPKPQRGEGRRNIDVAVDPGLASALRALEQTDTARLGELSARLSALFELQRETRGAPAVATAIRATVEELDKLQQAQRVPAILEQSERLRSEFLLAEKGNYGAIDEALRDLGAATKDTANLAKELGLNFSSAFEDAIVSGGNLRDLLQGIQQDLFRMATRKLVTEPLANGLGGLFEGLMGGGGDGGGGGGGAAAVGAAGADVLKSFFSGWFADGGYIPPGRWGMAGERGPEPVFGGRTGATVVPNGGGGSVTTVVQDRSRASSHRVM